MAIILLVSFVYGAASAEETGASVLALNTLPALHNGLTAIAINDYWLEMPKSLALQQIECLAQAGWGEARNLPLTGRAAVMWTVLHRAEESYQTPARRMIRQPPLKEHWLTRPQRRSETKRSRFNRRRVALLGRGRFGVLCNIVLQNGQYQGISPKARLWLRSMRRKHFSESFINEPPQGMSLNAKDFQALLETRRLAIAILTKQMTDDPTFGATSFVSRRVWLSNNSPQWLSAYRISTVIGRHVFLTPDSTVELRSVE